MGLNPRTLFVELADFFDVSGLAMGYRLANLGLR
jgi:hypothetical protein